MSSDNIPCLLVLFGAPDIRDTLVDWLLDYDKELMFSTLSIEGYGLDPGALSLAEQVAGHQTRLECRVETNLSKAQSICKGLSEAFPRLGLHYLILPLIENGRIGG